ncbi:transcriptional regulator [Streptomyces venezuelae]|uniref:Transcriptional regulator n=1 Tax=Streptomyces venezuelae TaxID=54571 RepID=A0A5P2CJU6_STRVZ|nr:helix-turn-helix transcriptional regulator [Streptomyces venezuelae]QES42753.1 transcriptional regulator [Streptomyces venezuelae]
MALRSHPTARQLRLGAELRKLREAAGMTARDAAALLGVNASQMTHIESGLSGVSEVRLRRLAAHYACTDEILIGALTAMATDRTRGWWEEYRGVLPPVFLDVAELEHHATYRHDVELLHVPGLLQTSDYAQAVFSYTRPEFPVDELETLVQHRMRRRTILEGEHPVEYEAIIHESALRIRVSRRKAFRAQLEQILSLSEASHVTVRVIPFALDDFAGASCAMMHVGGPITRLGTVLRDAPHGTAFIDSEAQLDHFRTLFRKVKGSSLEPDQSRHFIHQLTKEL